MSNNKAVIWPKIVLVGDSITQSSFNAEGCWGSLLAARLQRKCDLVNRGFSGYNSRWVKVILPNLVTADIVEDIAAVTIFLGSNDAADVTLNERQSVPLEEYNQNILDMIHYLLDIGLPKNKIILITPPPIVEDVWRQFCEDTEKIFALSNEMTGQFANVCKSLAEKTGVRVVDTYNSMMAEKNWAKFLSDGLHLSAEGSQFLDNLLWFHMETLTEKLPIMYPDWKEVDLENVEQSLIN